MQPALLSLLALNRVLLTVHMLTPFRVRCITELHPAIFSCSYLAIWSKRTFLWAFTLGNLDFQLRYLPYLLLTLIIGVIVL